MNSHTLLSPPSDSTTVLTQARTNNIVFQNTTNTPVPEVYTVCIVYYRAMPQQTINKTKIIPKQIFIFL
jgi:hypothetical protein